MCCHYCLILCIVSRFESTLRLNAQSIFLAQNYVDNFEIIDFTNQMHWSLWQASRSGQNNFPSVPSTFTIVAYGPVTSNCSFRLQNDNDKHYSFYRHSMSCILPFLKVLKFWLFTSLSFVVVAMLFLSNSEWIQYTVSIKVLQLKLVLTAISTALGNLSSVSLSWYNLH